MASRGRSGAGVQGSTITVISGLLLPIWDKLPSYNARVYRLQTEDGERIIGRLIAPDDLPELFAKLGITCKVRLTAPEIADAVMDRGMTVDLVEGLRIRRSRIMGAFRIEVVGFHPSHVQFLKQLGCVTEIIQWQTRVFVPLAKSVQTLERLIESYPQAESESQTLAA